MAIEVVLLAPIIVMLMLLLVGLGRFVEARGQVNGAARAAARAASVQRNPTAALHAATRVARSNLEGWCVEPAKVLYVGGGFTRGSLVTYRVTCTIDLTGLEMLGLDATRTFSAEATAPLDTYRSTD